MLIPTAILACNALTLSGLGVIGPEFIAPCSVSSVAVRSTNTEGSIKSVDLAAKTFILHSKDGNLELKVSDSTVFTLDGKASTFQDAVKAGRAAVVTHDDKSASKVMVTSA